MEQPQYVLKPDFRREFIPQIFLMIGLGALLYLGFFLNTRLLNIKVSSTVSYIIIGVIAVLILTNLILIRNRIRIKEYVFYPDRIELHGKKAAAMPLAQVSSMGFKQNFFDRMLNTGTIVLDKFSISNIGNTNQIYYYVQKLIQYAKRGSIPRQL